MEGHERDWCDFVYRFQSYMKKKYTGLLGFSVWYPEFCLLTEVV
jgi:hypothetical protein